MSDASRRRRKIYRKDPDSILDYNINWENWLRGDTIESSTWDVPSGIINLANTYNNTGLTTVFLYGGTVGQTYEIVNSITTAKGRFDQRSFFIKIVEYN